MEEPRRDVTTADSHSIFGISKAMCRSYYNSFITRWHRPEKTPTKAFEEPKLHHHQIDEAGCKGMNDKTGKMKKKKSFDDPIISSPEGSSHHSHRSGEGSTSSRKSSVSSTDDHPSSRLLSLPSMLLRSLSRRGGHSSSAMSSPLHHNLPKSPMKTPRSPMRTPTTSSSNNQANDGPFSSPKVKLTHPQALPEIQTYSRSISRTNSTATPIVFSQSTAKKKAPPTEKDLECTLEELSEGCVKQLLISRDVIINGFIEQEGELVNLKIKPGWKKGTKITFIGKGDERPGYQPADLVFSIKEKEHSLFRRVGDDLECQLEVPLVQALTGCNILVPLLGNKKMSLSLHNVIYPGYIEVINGEGMPKPNEEGKRGDLRINFRIKFPTQLTSEQRSQASSILQDCG